MICQKCGLNNATVHYTNIINGNKTEIHLCESCSKEKESGIPLGINDLMSGFLGIKTQNNKTVLKCDFCGSTQNDISKRGKAGCEHCYEIFGEYLIPIIRKVHGTDTHTGKVPHINIDNAVSASDKSDKEKEAIKPAEINNEKKELEERMKQAISEEDYEEAAKIRDELRKF